MFVDQCGPGVDLIGVFEVDVSITTFFNKDGEPVRLLIHENFNGVLTRSDTGNSIDDPRRITINIDLETGRQTVTGRWINATYPGVGEVFQVIGRSVFEPGIDGPVFKAGPGDFLIGLDFFEEVCAVLA